MTILYIDDDPDDHEFFREALQIISPTASCLRARNGQEALELLADLNFNPDYIFVDLNMPTMDGKQFIGMVKNSKHKGVPLIVFTTSMNQRDRTDCKTLGATKFLTKPADFRSFVTVVKSALNKADLN